MGLFIKIFIPTLLALSITYLLIPLWISVCHKWKLFDFPDERKQHAPSIPTMGGLAIFAGIFMSFFLFADSLNIETIRYLLCGVLLLFFTGFFDDLLDLPAMKKLAIQVLAAVIVVAGGSRIGSFYGLFGIHAIPEWAQYAASIGFIIAVTNAYNLIDGIDGLAGSIGLISSLILGFIFLEYQQDMYAILSFCISGSLVGFLFYNFHPARIFMGDTGSLLIGFLLSTLSINLLQVNEMSHSGSVLISPSLIAAVLFIPIYDTLRVFVIRLLNGDSPIKADRNHLHHMIIRQGFTHKGAAILLSLFNLSVIAFEHFMGFLNVNLFLILTICISIITMNTFVLQFLIRVRKKFSGAAEKKLETR